MESLYGSVYDRYPELVPGKDYFSGGDLDERFYPAPGDEDELWTNDDWNDGIMVSSFGKVYDAKIDSFLKHHFNNYGYPYVTIRRKNWFKNEFVHRIVCRNFIYNPDPKRFTIVRHMNGDRGDCYYENLRWGTSRDNTLDAMEHGMFSGRPPRRVKVYLKTGQILKFSSAREAAECLGHSLPSIRMNLSGYTSSVKGDYFVWAGDGE